MSWKGIVNVTFPSHLQTLMALFPKSKVIKGLVSRSVYRRQNVLICILSAGDVSFLVKSTVQCSDELNHKIA